MSFYNKDVIRVTDFSKEDLLVLMDAASSMCNGYDSMLLHDKILASLFFEPSTRTRLSFETAMKRLGGGVVGFSDWRDTSIQKGEDLKDTIKVISGYSDVIVIRHPENGSAGVAAEVSNVPVINGGDGSNEHPTQTFVDLFTIYRNRGSLDGLSIGFMGDLRYGRTVHSLVKALLYFDVDMYFVSPKELSLPSELLSLAEKSKKCFETNDIYEVSQKLDFLYATRIQKERFLSNDELKHVKNYHLKKDFLDKAKKGIKIMHPLPRVGELSHDLDGSENALYFQQAHNGIPVRMALLSLIFGKAKNFLNH